MYNTAVYQWLTHIILVNQEAEIRGLQFADSLGKKLRRTYLKKKKKNHHKKWLIQCLKLQALCQNSST
jgi:hypothetical protein